mmetsp:Transcript_59784/g.142296  ORF Transcript_59784/g.142296 Transcript_59784/m.142296 type:complete len:1248 (+) Transcript_59784:94-3837(+)
MAMRQLRVIPSGVQQLAVFRDTIGASADSFAYCSTMTLHVYRLKDNSLYKMIAAHERSISAIHFAPEDSNLLASSSVSGRVAIWDLEAEEERYHTKFPDPVMLMDWASYGDKIAAVTESGAVQVWDFRQDKVTKLFATSRDYSRVLRWHPRIPTKLLLGTSDGAVLVFDQPTGKKVQIVGKAKTSKDPVTDAQWDPLSEDYLLVAFQDGSLTLFDASTQREIHSFDKQSQTVRCIAWAASQPGNFITCTERIGVLRLWNVSQRGPLSQIKVGSSGVLSVKACPRDPNWFVLAFRNGSVGVCDIAQRTLRFSTTPGHAETIFDVVFHPDDPDMVATASYDGHVKLWRISSGESYREMFAGKDQLLYGLAFGPGASRVAAVSNTGNLFIWRCDTATEIHRLHVHTQQAYRVEWSHLGRIEGGGEIITGGADGYACVTDAATGTLLKRLHHPDCVVGVAWHPVRDGWFATACQDGNVRLYRMEGAEHGPSVTLQGHEKRVFNIAFHPICPNIIASGSDDLTIRVWNWNPAFAGLRMLRRLHGHSYFVRALLWHSELPHILFSGSWDSTIRVWDVVRQMCLHVAYEHHADVYGLALHPQRPFFLVSSSRDTTLRFWIFEDLVRPQFIYAVVRPSRFGDMLGSSAEEAEEAMMRPHGGTTFRTRLYGQASRALASTIMDLEASQRSLQMYQKIASFFLYRRGMEDLWGLIAVVRGEPQGTSSSLRMAFHEQELIQCQRSKALELASQTGTIGMAAGKYEQRLAKAAQIMLRIGDIRSYCRFMVQAGQWERAICIAPAVSQQFWQELCQEYMESLSATADIEEAAPFMVASGNSAKLIDSFIARNEMENAFVVAKADHDGLLMKQLPRTGAETTMNLSQAGQHSAEARTRLEDVSSSLSQRYSSMCEPVQAAMCYLAVSNVSRAVSVLSRSHEVVLAYITAALVGKHQDPIVLKLMAHSAERDQLWELAASIWQQHPHGPGVHLPLLATRCPDKVTAQNWCPWTQSQLEDHRRSALSSGNKASVVLAAVCLGDNAQAASVGVQGLHELFSRSTGWSITEARAILDPLESLPLQDMEVKDIAGVLSCAAYVGFVEACFLGYDELIFPLAQTLRNIIMHQNLQFPISVSEIDVLEATTLAHRDPERAQQLLSTALGSASLPPNLRAVCERHLAALPRIHKWSSEVGPGFEKLAGGDTPHSYKRHARNSVLTNQLIRGPTFALEDEKLHISLGDALAWTRVNAFSPLNTGYKIHPV